MYKSKSFWSHWTHQKGQPVLITSAPGRYWDAGFCMSGMTLEGYGEEPEDLRMTNRDSSWSTAHPGSTEKLRGVGQGLLGPHLQCTATPQAPLDVGREDLKQLKAAMCPGQVLPDVCVVLSIHTGSCTRWWMILSQPLGICYVLYSNPTQVAVKVLLTVNKFFKGPVDFGFECPCTSAVIVTPQQNRTWNTWFSAGFKVLYWTLYSVHSSLQ